MAKVKNRYSVDSFNRLTIRRKGKTTPVNGKFLVDKDNNLSYWLNEPVSWRREYGLPGKVSFKGKWRLDKNYDLQLRLAETRRHGGQDILTIRGNIISVEKDCLLFEVKSYDKQGLLHARILKLSGIWQADRHNQLSFAVKKKHEPDMLTLEGAWQVNQNQKITYSYDKIDLKRKTKINSTLIFEGFWEINEANRLTYILSRTPESKFDFRAQLESPNLYPKEGVIKYRLGIGLKGLSPKGTVPQPRIISLYGTWRFNRRLSLLFEMDYGRGHLQSMEFTTEISCTQKDKFTFTLRSKKKEPLRINITFTRRFLKRLDAKALLRVKRILGKESALEAGVELPF